MPKTNLCQPDPRDVELRAVIYSGMKKSRYANLKTLAAAVGISEPTLSNWMRNPRLFRHGTLIEILDLLKIPDEDQRKIF